MAEKLLRLPIRNPWQVVDYASKRGEEPHGNGALEIQSHLSLIDCGLGDSNEGPPSVLDEVLQATLNSGELREAFWKYPADKFCENPASLIEQRFGLSSSENRAIIFDGPGSYGLLAKIIWGLPDLTADEELGILGIGPQFPNVAALAEGHGRKPDGSLVFPYSAVTPPLELSSDQKIAFLIKERETNNGHRFLYVDNPNNPTGDFASLEVIRNLADFALSHNDVLIVDEAYADLLPDEQSAIHLVDYYQNLIVLRGVAKTIGLAGARVGYAVTSSEIGKLYKSLQLVFGIPGPQQLVLNQILKPEILTPHLNKIKQQMMPLKKLLVDGLDDLGIWVSPTHPSVPIFLAKGPQGFFQSLKSYQIVTERGSDFRTTYPALDDSFVRIKVPNSPKEVDEVLKRVKQILQP